MSRARDARRALRDADHHPDPTVPAVHLPEVGNLLRCVCTAQYVAGEDCPNAEPTVTAREHQRALAKRWSKVREARASRDDAKAVVAEVLALARVCEREGLFTVGIADIRDTIERTRAQVRA